MFSELAQPGWLSPLFCGKSVLPTIPGIKRTRVYVAWLGWPFAFVGAPPSAKAKVIQGLLSFGFSTETLAPVLSQLAGKGRDKLT